MLYKIYNQEDQVKRCPAILLCCLFIFGYAVDSYAIHAEIPSETQAVTAKGATWITLGGELRFRGWYVDNVIQDGSGYFSVFVPAESPSQAWYDARVRLNLRAEVSANTTGHVALETNSLTSDTYIWGSFNSKPADMNILEAWIQHKGSGLFGVPAGVKIGHMPLKLSEGQFLDLAKFGSDAIVFFMDPTEGVHAGLLTTKVEEKLTGDNTDDVDAYVALLTYKTGKDHTAGANYTHINGPDNSLRFWNLGVHANGSISGLMYRAEVDLQGGSESSDPKIRFGGYGIFAEVSYKFDPVTIKARYGYGSGDKNSTLTKNEEFQTILGNDIHHTFIYEYIIDGGAFNQAFEPGSTTLYRGKGLANTSMLSLGASAPLTKDLEVSADGYLLRANTTVGSGSSRDIGSECDLRLVYRIAGNLTYSITAGYFSPGNYWHDEYRFDFHGWSGKSVIAAMHALTLSF
jgi:hypothetical protein